MTKASALLLAVGLLLLPVPARAQFPTTAPDFTAPAGTETGLGTAFGSKGQIVLSSDLDLDFIHDSIQPPSGDAVSLTDLRIAPAFDWFVAKNFAIGGLIVFQYQTGDALGFKGNTMGFQVGPQLGYNLAITPRLTLFPKLGGGYRMVSQTSKNTLGVEATSSGYAVNLALSVPFLFHPVPHFFIGLGPIVSIDLMAKVDGDDTAKHRIFGAAMQVGGWW